jgi:carboxymethylenebutenolidase
MHQAAVRLLQAGPGGAGEIFRPTIGKPGSWPGVLLVPDSEGLTESIREFASSLASEGYMVLAMEPYDGKPSPADQEQDGWTRESEHNDNLIKIEDGLGLLENQMMDTSKIAIVGWGAGGTLAADVAVAEDNVKVVVLNGGHLPVDPASVSRLKAAVVGSFAGDDSTDSHGESGVFIAAMKRAGKSVDLKVYPNAVDASDARQRTLVSLAEYLKPKLATGLRKPN